MSKIPEPFHPSGSSPVTPGSKEEDLPAPVPSVMPPKTKPPGQSKEDLANPHRHPARATLVSTPIAAPREPAPAMPPAEPEPPVGTRISEPDPATAATESATHSQDAGPLPWKTAPGPAPAAATADARERRWLIILGISMVVVAGLVVYLLRQAFPSDDPSQPVDSPSLPVKGRKLTLDALTLRWRHVADRGEEGIRGKSLIVPEAIIRLNATSNGALRVFFRNDHGEQIGDTANLKVKDGMTRESDGALRITCSEGLSSTLDYDSLRSRENKEWTIEILEGDDPMAPIASFNALARVIIPWNLSDKPEP